MKRTIGETVTVRADVFRDGHDVVRAALRHRAPGAKEWSESPMARVHDGPTRWAGSFAIDALGTWQFAVEAWSDPFASWRDELQRKLDAGQEDLASELSEGAEHLRGLALRAGGSDAERLARAAVAVGDANAPAQQRADAALDAGLTEIADRFADRGDAAISGPFLLTADREQARFSSWYELFPRSWGGFAGVTEQLPKLAELGFDVIYLPPVHPIGRTNRKGPNNALVAGPGDPGSPWAIGDRELGGHDALHPELGSWDEFDAMVAAAEGHGLDIALDFAIQCSADHPWLTEHPEWFHRRPDGTLKYAENPPKKYQDIYNVNWDTADWRALWQALYDALMVWVERGVLVFRVDNPHTKPLAFWEWLIAEVRAEHPGAIFLAEAFTEPTMMRALGKIGFDQSYTYFTWKTSRHELTEYVLELATSGMQEYYRPNFFVNTPDILHASLVDGGPAAFRSRLVLAATLSPSYGIYSGFEHYENVPVRPGSEEYLDSEKYELKARRLDGPLLPFVALLNAIRRDNPALQQLPDIAFLETANDNLMAYVKRSGGNVVVAVVNLDPHSTHEGLVTVPAHLGLPPAFAVEDLLDPAGARFDWRIGANFVRLAPGEAHVLRLVTA